MREPQDVCNPRTQILSLIAMGTPASKDEREFPTGVSEELCGGFSSARFNAPVRSICRNAFNVSFSFSAEFTADSTTMRAVVSPLEMRDLID